MFENIILYWFNSNPHSCGDICSVYVSLYIQKPHSKNQYKKKELWKKERWRHSGLAQGQGWGVSSIYTKKSERSLKSPTLLKIEVAFVLKASSLCKWQSIPHEGLIYFLYSPFPTLLFPLPDLSFLCDIENILKLFPSFIQHSPFLLLSGEDSFLCISSR